MMMDLDMQIKEEKYGNMMNQIHTKMIVKIEK
jgi:hypothetical protein